MPGIANSLVFFLPLCLLSGVLALIDLRNGIIPDWLNATIACLGLVKIVAAGGWLSGLEAASEAVIVGAVFWLLRRLYFARRNIQGLGLGDVKFLAAAAIWIGVSGVSTLLLVASLTALIVIGVLKFAGQKFTGRTSVPFGPFLAIGLLVAVEFQQYW
jgi:leader peptidase (prepilin peptidase)/N-methyltransferase